MKLKNNFQTKILSVIFLLIGFYNYAQTDIVVDYYTGAKQQYTVSDSGKLFFSNDNLMIKKSSADTEISIPISIISKITFKNSLAVEDVGENKAQVKIYPNPTNNYFKISSKDSKLTVNIYNSNGQLVLSGIYKKDEEINISNLSTGVYFVQVNGSTLKLIKK